MSMIREITAVVTSLDIGTPIALDQTPLLGGQGRNAILTIPVPLLTAVVSLEGAGMDPTTGAAPAEDSEDWTEIVELTSASDPIQEITLPQYIRWNTTTLDADGPDLRMYLEGVQ